MKYISRQHVTGGMSRVVHILATKLGSPLSCITPTKYDAEGGRCGDGLSWMASTRGNGPMLTHQETSHLRATWLTHVFSTGCKWIKRRTYHLSAIEQC